MAHSFHAYMMYPNHIFFTSKVRIMDLSNVSLMDELKTSNGLIFVCEAMNKIIILTRQVLHL